jgi:hypothetical protein
MSLRNEIANNVPTKKVTKKPTSQTPSITENQMENVSKIVSSAFGLDSEIEGFDVICLSMQKGGVNTKQGGGKSNRNKVNIPFEYGGKSITTSQVNKYILNTLPNLKIRQVARAFGTEIAQRSELYGEKGFLLKQLNELYPEKWANITHESKDYWAADFQHDNPECPEEIRDLLKLRYQDKYKPINQRSYNLNKQGESDNT